MHPLECPNSGSMKGGLMCSIPRARAQGAYLSPRALGHEMQALPMDDASAAVIQILKDHTVVCRCSMPLSPSPQAGGFIEYVDSDLHSRIEPYGLGRTYRLHFVIEGKEPSRYYIKVRPLWSTGFHPSTELYNRDFCLDMRMRETGQCDFEFHGAHWSVQAIHVLPSA